MKVLITGGAGFIGSNLAKRLLKENCEVRILDNFSEQIHGTNKSLDESLEGCLLYTSPSPRDRTRSRMPSSA